MFNSKILFVYIEQMVLSRFHPDVDFCGSEREKQHHKWLSARLERTAAKLLITTSDIKSNNRPLGGAVSAADGGFLFC